MAGVVHRSVEMVWSRSLHSNSYAMTVAAGSVVVAERHSRLVLLQASSGEKQWDQPVEDCWGTATIAGDRALYLSQAGSLHCFDLHTGRPLWVKPDLMLRHHVSVSGADIFLGGWRGYHPLVRLSLADGAPLPFDDSALDGMGPLAAPLPLRLAAHPGSEPSSVLIAGAARPALVLLTASGVVRAEWTLPEPVTFPDIGGGYSRGADGSATFLSGRRTVMAVQPDRGVRVLWRHQRDLRPWEPMLDDQTLWLVDDAGIAVIDVAGGAVRDVGHRQHGNVCAAALVSGHGLFAFADGSLITLDRDGNVVASTRVTGRIDRLVPGDLGLVHAAGKGRLITFRVDAGNRTRL
jgi:hypothetical protein